MADSWAISVYACVVYSLLIFTSQSQTGSLPNHYDSEGGGGHYMVPGYAAIPAISSRMLSP